MLEIGGAAAGAAAAGTDTRHDSDIERQRRLHAIEAAVDAERRACRRIVEDRLRLMVTEPRTDPVLLVRAIITDIDARARGEGGRATPPSGG